MIKPLVISILTVVLLSCKQDRAQVTGKKIVDSTATSVPSSTNAARAYPFQLTIHDGSNWNIKIDTISGKEFDYENKILYQPKKKINGDSLLTIFSHKFRNAIILTDSCCILKGLNRELKVCRKRSGDDHQWTGYDAVAYDHGFLILMEWGYERWGYISFNPVTQQYTYTSNEPRFINDSLIYAAGNYYGEGQFQMKDLKEDKYFGFESFNWTLTGFYLKDNSVLMEFTSRTTKKYIKVRYN